MKEIPTLGFVALIIAPTFVFVIYLIFRKTLLNMSQKQRRKYVTILFISLILFIISLPIYSSLSEYGNLKGVLEFLKDRYSNWGTIFLSFFIFVLFIYQFFRKDKKSQVTSDQKSK